VRWSTGIDEFRVQFLDLFPPVIGRYRAGHA
jgi:hypothetical protein